MNEAQWDFGMNWRHWVEKAGIDYFIIAATDAPTSARLAEQGDPCFERIDEESQKLGLEWGQEGWRRMTWNKVFLLDALIDWGFNLVISDLDVAWFKDPMPLFTQHPHADLLFSHDGTSSWNEPGDAGLEAAGSPHSNYNTGVYLIRNNAATQEWAHAFAKSFSKCTSHEQPCAYELMRIGATLGSPHPSTTPGEQARITSIWDNKLWMGILPASIAMNAHTLFLQRLHEVKGVEPYVVHMTWTYNGIPGKRSRLRDLGLWVDPPEYYSAGDFVTVNLTLPEPPASYNSWNENEDMISFHLDWIHAQLQQAYAGMALAVSAGRTFVLPKFVCYCEKIWYSVVRCRTAEAQNMTLPVPCPQDYLFVPGNYADEPQQFGTALDLRESFFLDNERTPAAVKESVLTIQPSAELDCTDCVKEAEGGAAGGGPLLLVPPMLTDAQLLPLLQQYRKYRVWRLSFAGVGTTQRAYAGFAKAEEAEAFNRRIEHITTNFCCRREEESPRYHKQEENSVQLSMMRDFRFLGGATSAEALRSGSGMVKAATLLLAAVLAAAPPPAHAALSKLWGAAGELWDARGPLPDFSFAGYMQGNSPLPTPPVTRSVLDFRKPRASDTDMFLAALAWAHRQPVTAGSIVLAIPPGTFTIEKQLRIRRPRLVLRGAGREKTALYIPKSLTDVLGPNKKDGNGFYVNTGGFINLQGESEEGKPVATVLGRPRKGETRLRVDNTKGIQPGQLYDVWFKDIKGKFNNLMFNNLAVAPDTYAGSTRAKYTARVLAVKGEIVVLERRLPYNIDPEAVVARIHRRPDTVHESGVEGFTVKFPWSPYGGHHCEVGYNAFEFRLAYDCWARDVGTVNADNALVMFGVTSVTVSGLLIQVTKTRANRIPNKWGETTDADGHWGVQHGHSFDILVENLDSRCRLMHDAGTDAASKWGVFMNSRMRDGSLDMHRGLAGPTLYTSIDVGVGSRALKSGGPGRSGPNALAGTTWWGITSAKPITPPQSNDGAGACSFGSSINLVGVNLDQAQARKLCKNWWYERSVGGPANLYEAQLARRRAGLM
ncbi:glycosyltransferase family 77 isoform A [Micractinium conductrix]|uniref:Glycosyltransferase n=1 Tax=Micractinium conductrix TaxID=554055 RepID=A0A2P6VQ71_9CHLO|nr:glycosyltransferase family 77 isoform A [Micractinium conductrix]|eukprot:PSC76256.1 glycosyltransferase family 77 isoform A [Micractinium conductrix]